MAKGYTSYPNLTPNTYVETATYDPRLIRTGKYTIQASSGDNFQTSEVFVMHDNKFVYTKETNLIYTTDPFVSYTAQFTSNSVKLLANSSIPNTDLVIYGIELNNSSKANVRSDISQDKIFEYAQAMKAFYPDDNTDYVAKMAGSLYNSKPIANLHSLIKEIGPVFNSPKFTSLSNSEKNEFLKNYANTINTAVKEIENNINSDIASFDEVSNKIAIGGKLFSIASNYSNPEAKKLLEMTLNPTVASAIANTSGE